MLTLKNPHSIAAVLKKRPEALKVFFKPYSHKLQSPWQELCASLSAASKIENAPEVGALVLEKPPVSFETLIQGPHPENSVWIALDCLKDPQNLGAIFRTAAFCGIQGIVMTSDRSVKVNATVMDVACGGVEIVPYAEVTNLAQALQKAKDQGIWVLGTTEHQGEKISKIQRDRPWMVVFGSEEDGMRRLTLEKCDQLAKIFPQGELTSLNVAVAVGMTLFHLTSLE